MPLSSNRQLGDRREASESTFATHDSVQTPIQADSCLAMDYLSVLLRPLHRQRCTLTVYTSEMTRLGSILVGQDGHNDVKQSYEPVGYHNFQNDETHETHKLHMEFRCAKR